MWAETEEPMNKTGSRLAVSALIVSLALGLPGGLAAKERRGAELVVTSKDGRVAQGELIAVKPASLLLLDHMTGRDVSVALTDVSLIRIVRESKALTGLLIGLVPGAVGGAVWGAHASAGDMPELGAFLGGLTVGTIAGLVGLAAGFGMGIDSIVRYSGLTEAEQAVFLVGLDRRAREPGVFVPKAVGPANGKAAAASVAAVAPWTRFRLSWAPAYVGGFAEDRFRTGVIPFRFTESLPPGEAGPYDSTYYWAEHYMQEFSLGRLALSYQWSRRLGAEIELSTCKYMISHLAELNFTSTFDGLAYQALFGDDEITRTISVLVGLTYLAIEASTLQPHAVELAAAVGPAWISTVRSPYYPYEESFPVDRRTTWTARARISYDYHFSRNLSMGAFGEYRWLKAEIPSYGVTEELEFSDYPGPYFLRLTEVTLPAQSLDMGGFACGLRFGFGF
jgi:hypothetical protein